ncbi:unnamed protein product, partial [Hapterophycus canaliculatus]
YPPSWLVCFSCCDTAKCSCFVSQPGFLVLIFHNYFWESWKEVDFNFSVSRALYGARLFRLRQFVIRWMGMVGSPTEMTAVSSKRFHSSGRGRTTNTRVGAVTPAHST